MNKLVLPVLLLTLTKSSLLVFLGLLERGGEIFEAEDDEVGEQDEERILELLSIEFVVLVGDGIAASLLLDDVDDVDDEFNVGSSLDSV
jgi:hypothetical protein